MDPRLGRTSSSDANANSGAAAENSNSGYHTGADHSGADYYHEVHNDLADR